jgi:hypothetical protein
VVAVATPEEMAVNETLWLRDALAQDELAIDVAIANACYPERFAAAEEAPLSRAHEEAKDPLVRASLRAALSQKARSAAQREQLARLRAGLGRDVLELPFLFSEDIGRGELEHLADQLDAGMASAQPAPTAAGR